ncbi:hypothetical protein [Streptomyces sparsogenes]|uniref:hypothetical protein n=1 Tax=Streptomyces sparsogenes TaxID=67365 RepID=UPI003D9E21CA
MLTRPAPRRLRPDEAAAEERELRTDTEREEDRPDPSERDSRPDTDRRDEDDRDDGREEERPLPDEPLPRTAPRPMPVTPVGGEPTIPSRDTTGAIPHVSQYSWPPPTSSYDPPHPRR